MPLYEKWPDESRRGDGEKEEKRKIGIHDFTINALFNMRVVALQTHHTDNGEPLAHAHHPKAFLVYSTKIWKTAEESKQNSKKKIATTKCTQALLLRAIGGLLYISSEYYALHFSLYCAILGQSISLLFVRLCQPNNKFNKFEGETEERDSTMK